MLRLLSLYMVPMKEQRLDVLTRMPRLDQLALNTPELDVEDVRLVLSKLPQLKTLGLAFDDLEARHLEPLRGAQDLYWLDVRLCKGINDEIIPLLLSFPRLQTVFLDWTSVTSDGIDRLRAARPDLDISVEMGK